MYVGVDYYPEHWDRSRWKVDAALMRKAGFNVVRLAEFAWQNMEPEEGQFTFGWLDDVLSLLAKHGISAILGTPTAAMPAWVAHRYPQALALNTKGRREPWGVRKDCCFTDEDYRRLSRQVTRAMAEHFRKTTNVIGWQTDNEFGGGVPPCCCDRCRTEFQGWLKARYKTLARLNTAMGTHFWGQSYGNWDEIVIPEDSSRHNPSLCLEWDRFTSWLNVRFQSEQVQILRAVCPRHFITHNFMGLFSKLNYYDLAKDLDVAGLDSYPVGSKPEVTYRTAMACDVTRGLKRKPYWILEQTAGPKGWSLFRRNPRPGEIRKVAYAHLAHGGDNQLWFRWRTCTAGREQYWHGLLGHDGRPLRRYAEAAQTAREFHKLAQAIAGTTIKAKVAMIYDYESKWAIRIQPGYEKNLSLSACDRYYRPLFRAGVGVDMIKPTEDFSPYKVIFAPDLYVLPDAVARAIERFVKRGGLFVAEGRFGVKDATNLCHARTLPGLLSDALGIEIQEYEGLDSDIVYAVRGSGALEGRYQAGQYCDWILPRSAEVWASYDAWHLKPYAAATRNCFGRGFAYYVGTVVNESAFYDKLVGEVLRTAGLRGVITPPPGTESVVREGQGKKLLFLINHLEEPVEVDVPCGRRELITGAVTGSSLTLDRYGVAVIDLRRQSEERT